MRRQRRAGLLLLFVCLLAALAGQYCFSHFKDRLWDGVAFYALALACLVRLLSRQPAPAGEEPVSLWERAWRAVRAHLARVWSLGAALFCVLSAILLNNAGRSGPAVLFWLLGIVASVAAWYRLRQEAAGPREAEALPGDLATKDAKDTREAESSHEEAEAQGEAKKEPRTVLARWPGTFWGWFAGMARTLPWEALAVAGCTLAALLLRLVQVGTIPYVIGGDEASMGLDAVAILEGRLTDPFVTGWLSHPTLYFYLLAGPISLLGRNAWGLRLLSPLAGAATIPVIYLLARRLFDRRVALAGMVLLTVSHLHIHFSRLALNNIYDPLFGLLAFLFVVRGLQEGHVLDFALAGFFLGFDQYFYMGGRLIPIMMAGYLVLWVLLHPGTLRRLVVPAVALGTAFLATWAPLLRYFLLHPGDFSARLGQVGIIQMGWLQTEPLVTGKSVLELLWDQFRKSFLAFNYTTDPTSWYAAKIPYLDFVSGLFFILGLVVVLRNARKAGYLLVNVWFWLAIIFGGVLIENPPSSARFVIFMPAVCLIAALGLVQVLDLAAGLFRLPRAWAARVLAAILLVIAVLNVGFYFFQYTPSREFGGLNTEVGTRVGEYLHGQEPGSHVYFFGPPRMWVGYASIPFLAPRMGLEDVVTPLTAPPTFVAPDSDALFVFLPERTGELSWVIQAYPQGQRRDVIGHTGETLFSVYEVRR